MNASNNMTIVVSACLGQSAIVSGGLAKTNLESEIRSWGREWRSIRNTGERRLGNGCEGSESLSSLNTNCPAIGGHCVEVTYFFRAYGQRAILI